MPPRTTDWLTVDEARLFAGVLESTPVENRRGAPRVRPVSFYSSELKAASAIPARLQQIAGGEITEADLATRSVQRYTNTLRNLGLIAEDRLILTRLGKSVRRLPLPGDVAQLALAVDGTIFRGLADILRASARVEPIPHAAKFFAPFVLNARDFFDPIPSNRRRALLADDYSLLLLQLIFSHGPEIRRFWGHSERERALMVSAFTRAYRHNPNRIPTDQSRSFYLYTNPLAKNTVQADVRHRVRGLLTAYLELETNSPAVLRELISAAQVAVAETAEELPPSAVENMPLAETSADDVLPVEHQQPERETPLAPLPAVRAPEMANELPLAQRRKATAPRVSGRAAAVRRFSKRAQEYGRWAEACVIEYLRERDRRGEISTVTWRSDIGETPGWDIDYVEVETNTLKRIEVKGTKLSSVDVVDLTANEMAKLQEHRGNYALVIVTNCAHATRRPKVFFLWDPAGYFEHEGIEPATAIWTVRLSG